MRVLILLLALTGCAQTVAGNEAGGIITGNGVTMATGKAVRMADEDCAKYGKIARVKSQSEWDGALRYECVAKSDI